MELNSFGCSVSSLSAHLEDLRPASQNSNEEETSQREGSSGIWLLASRINHSCIGNCRRSFIGDMQIIRATKYLKAGAELEFSYVAPDTYSERTKLLTTWGFVCNCILCEDARKDDNFTIAKRNVLRRGLLTLFEAGGPSGLSMDVAKAERTLAQLEATYRKETLGTVPRMMAWDPYQSLARVYFQRGNFQKGLWAASKTFELLAFSVKGLSLKKGQDALVIDKWGFVSELLIELWTNLRTAFAELGDGLKSQAAMHFAKMTYRIVVGEDETFEEHYGR